MRNLLFVLALQALTIHANAFNEPGKRVTLSAGFGLLTVPQIIQGTADLLGTGLSGGLVRYEDATFTGAFIVGGKFLAGKKLTLGIDGVYEKFTKNVYNDSNDQLLGESSGRYISLIPRLDFYWLNNPGIRLYSGVGVGASFAQESFGNDKEDKILFAFNATPIGIEAGSTICVYAETCLGYNGLINAGLRLRF